eukprot:Gb_41562 [translate_table: standard]
MFDANRVMQERSAYLLPLKPVEAFRQSLTDGKRGNCTIAIHERLSLLALKDAYRSPRLSLWRDFNCCEWDI